MAASPRVEHHFNGDAKILNATLDRRSDLRRALAALQAELARVEGVPVQISAEVSFNVAGAQFKEHKYSVSITDPAFDQIAFARNKIPVGRALVVGSASSPPASNHGDRRPSSARMGVQDDDDVTEMPPYKKARTDALETLPTPSRSREAGSISEDSTLQRVDELLKFVKGWHEEWTGQGGWLFDSLNAQKTAIDQVAGLEKKLDVTQDILGQSINAASASTMTELANLAKLLPWLEHCRKTNADKVQAREEKWRSSSATFHDQARKDREIAEKRLDDKLEAQRQLLIKIAEANGVDVEELEEDKSRESSLGAQLTAELNLEATRAEKNRNIINIDD